MVRPSNTVPQLFGDIKTQLDVDNFEIVMQTSKDGEEVCVTWPDAPSIDLCTDFSPG